MWRAGLSGAAAGCCAKAVPVEASARATVANRILWFIDVSIPAATEPPSRRSTPARPRRSEEHTSELQSLMRISYAVFCLKKKKTNTNTNATPRFTKQHHRSIRTQQQH